MIITLDQIDPVIVDETFSVDNHFYGTYNRETYLRSGFLFSGKGSGL